MGHKKFVYRGVTKRPVSRRTPDAKYDVQICTHFLHHKTKKVAVQRSVVAAHTTQAKAKQAADDAAFARDFGPATTEPLETRLQTHFRITVVADAFRRMSMIERYGLVYEMLMREFWKPSRVFEPEKGPSRWLSFGTTGPRVRSLPPYRYFLRSFTLRLLTPDEWKPPSYESSTLAQKFGDSLIGTSRPNPAVTASAKDLVRLLRSENRGGGDGRNFLGNRTERSIGSHLFSKTAKSTLASTASSDMSFSSTSHMALIQQLHDTASFGNDDERSTIAMRSHHWASTARTKDPAKLRNHFVQCQIQLGKAAVCFQRNYRRHLSRRMHRMWLRRQRAVICMQRVYRGYVSRVFCLKREMCERRYFFDVLLPKAILIQQAYRGHRCRRLLRERRMKDLAAETIQRFWRAILAKRSALRQLNVAVETLRRECATRLQTHFRAFLARTHVTTRRRILSAHAIDAALRIQQQWRMYKARLRVRRVRLKIMSVRHNVAVKECSEDADEIREEIAQLVSDKKFMTHMKKRILRHSSHLKKTREAMLKRIPDVEKEIDELDSDDERGGWMEALESEWTSLQQRVLMAKADLETKALNLADLNAKIDNCTLEIEELEFDLDECESQRLRSHWKMQLSEIEGVEDAVEREWIRRVAKQKQLWGVRNQDLRRIPVKREYGKHNPPPRPSLNPVSLLSSVSFKDNKKREMLLRQWQYEMKMRDRALEWSTTQANGSENPKLHETFNRATNNVLGLMKLVSFASAFEQRELGKSRVSEPCLTCGRANCICNYVPEEESLF
eukprot:g333.t1